MQQLSRKQGYWEAGSTLFYELNHGASMPAAVVELGGTVEACCLTTALAAIHARHPLLRCAIEKRSGDGLYFVERVREATDGAGAGTIPAPRRATAHAHHQSGLRPPGPRGWRAART